MFADNSFPYWGKLSGKTALITGGDTAVGMAVTLAFMKAGANIFLWQYRPVAHENEAFPLALSGERQAMLVYGNLHEASHRGKVMGQVSALFGQVDVLVDNTDYQLVAGGCPAQHPATCFAGSQEQIHQQILRTALPYLKPRGVVIHIASPQAEESSPVAAPPPIVAPAPAPGSQEIQAAVKQKALRLHRLTAGHVWHPAPNWHAGGWRISSPEKDERIRRVAENCVSLAAS